MPKWLVSRWRHLFLVLLISSLLWSVSAIWERWGAGMTCACWEARDSVLLRPFFSLLPQRWEIRQFARLCSGLVSWGVGLGWLLLVGWIALQVWFKRFSRRRLVATVMVVVVLCTVNAIRLRLWRFEAGADAWLRRSARLEAAAQSFEQHAVLAGLRHGSHSAPVIRLADRLAAAAAGGRSEAGQSIEPHRHPLDLEFDGRDRWRLEPVGLEGSQDGDVLSVVCGRGGILESSGSIGLSADRLSVIEIRARHARGASFQIGLSGHETAGATAYDSRAKVKRLTVHVVPGGRWQIYRVLAEAVGEAPGSVFPDGVVRKVFIRPSDLDDDVVEFDFIRFKSRTRMFGDRPFGRRFHRAAGQAHDSIFGTAPLRLPFDLRVPTSGARFSAALAILEESEQIGFVVAVEEAAGRRHEILSEEVAHGSSWLEVEADLTPWGGRDVTLRLEMAGSPGAVGFWGHPTVYGVPSEPLDVILIVEDALRADRTSLYDGALPTTPAKMNWFARRGVVFERALSQATKTRPSAASYMTGLLPSATGVLDHHHRLADAYVTLAEILSSLGFATASFIQNGNAGPEGGLGQGFETIVDSSALGRRADGVYSGTVLDWLERHRDRNTFAYLHVLDPHGPYDPPEPHDRWYRERGPGRTPVVPDGKLHDPAWVETPTLEGRRLLYDGEVRHNDQMIERFLLELETRGLLQHTLLVFMSDHGEHLGEHANWEHHPPGYINVIRVPLAIVFPDGLGAGDVVASPVQLADVMPTILDIAGVDPTQLALHGDSLLPLVRGEERQRWQHRLILSEEVVNRTAEVAGAWGSIVYGRWHLINSREFFRLSQLAEYVFGWPEMHEFGAATRVHDLERDPEERWLLNPFLVDPLLKWRFFRLLRHVRASGELFHTTIIESHREPETLTTDPEEIERLRSLGYL